MNKYHEEGTDSGDVVQARYFPGSNLFVDLSNYPNLKTGSKVVIRDGRGIVKAIHGDKVEIVLDTLDVESEEEPVKVQDDPYGVDHDDEEEY